MPLMPSPSLGLGSPMMTPSSGGYRSDEPEGDAGDPGDPGEGPPLVDDRSAAAEHVERGDDGEEREPGAVVGEVADERSGVADQTGGAEHREDDERRQGDHEQGVGDEVEVLLGGADRDDARGHGEREVAGEERRDR